MQKTSYPWVAVESSITSHSLPLLFFNRKEHSGFRE